MRSSAGLHHADCEPDRATGAAGSETGHHAGIRRVAAFAAAGGERNGARINFDRRNDFGGRGAADWIGEPGGRARRFAGDGGSDREENYRQRTDRGAIRDGSGGTRDGDAAGRRFVPRGDAVRFVLRDGGHARGHGSFRGEAAGEVRRTLSNGDGKIQTGENSGWIECRGAAYWRGGEPVQCFYHRPFAGGRVERAGTRRGGRKTDSGGAGAGGFRIAASGEKNGGEWKLR